MRIEYRGTKVETEIKIELILTWTRKVGPCEKWSNSRHIRKGFLADDELNVGVKKKIFLAFHYHRIVQRGKLKETI